MTVVAYGKVVARREDEYEEATVYEWAGSGYLIVVGRKDCDYDLGTKFFAKLEAAISYAELVLWPKEPSTRSFREWAESFGERAILLAEGSPLWMSAKASRPYFAYKYARAAAEAAFIAMPELRGEPKRNVEEIRSQAKCECGHALCYHEAVRLPCLFDCACRAFKQQPPPPPAPPSAGPVPPRPCPKCDSPQFDHLAPNEIGTFSIFVIRCNAVRVVAHAR